MDEPWTIQAINRQLDLHRQEGDPLADEVFQFLKNDPTTYHQFKELTSNADLLAFALEASPKDLLDELNKQLAEFDQVLLEQGHLVFEKYAVPIMAVLALYALPYCYAGENGSKVLVQSKYLVENPRKRLEETGEFLFAVGSKNAFTHEGFGLLQCMKVRLLHAGARFYAKVDGEVSVNQEDLLGTNLAFSLITIRGLQKVGVEMSADEKYAYIYLWNCVGLLLGINSTLLPSDIRQAAVLERAIRIRQFRPNADGATLMQSLVDMYAEDWPFKGLRPEDMISGFLGKEVSKCVGLDFSDIFSGASLTPMKLKNSFTRFSADNFPRLQDQIAKGQFTF
ncbi:MAG: oxygenase MpaB family protein [Cytophagales bacterium]|nr:oxygenase MpaB family protein [Cytophagales bacterium]